MPTIIVYSSFDFSCISINVITEFQVKVMTEMQIDQSKASIAMSVFGALELTSRLLMSYLGDYIKGRILYSYVAFCLGLSVLNLVAAQASTFEHMLAYGVCE